MGKKNIIVMPGEGQKTALIFPILHIFRALMIHIDVLKMVTCVK